MATSATVVQPTPQPGFFDVGFRVLALALPLMVGSLVAAGQGVAKLTLLTYGDDSNALYTLSLVQPGFILMLAFMESLAIANQVFSSKSYKNWPKGDIYRSTRLMSVLGTVLIILVAAAIYNARSVILAGNVVHPVLPDMALYVLSFVPFFLFELRNAALRGQGRTALALLPFAVLIVVDLTVTAVGILYFDLGFQAVLIGNVVGPVIAYPLTCYLLHREVGSAKASTDGSFKRNVIRMLIGVAAPTFLTTFAGSIAAMIIFPMLANFSENAVSSFLLIIRIRVLFIIPAIAAGSAIAILINKKAQGEHGLDSKRILTFGTLLIGLIYIAATAALYFGYGTIVGLVVPIENPDLRVATRELFLLLLMTFFCIGVGTMLQVILEHLGWGVLVVITTLITESAIIAGALVLLHWGADLPSLTLVMNAAAAFSLIAYVLFFMRLVRTYESPNAV